MKEIKIIVVSVFSFILIGKAFAETPEKDVIRSWIKEDMEDAAGVRLEELAATREKEKSEEAKPRIKQLYKEADELLKLKRYEDAKERYRKILSLNPAEFKAEEYIARIDEIIKISTAKESERLLTHQEKEKRDKFQKSSREGAELYRLKKYKEAREKWEEALRYDPDNESLREWVKRGRMKEIEMERAEVAFEKDLEEKMALSVIDEAYLPRRRAKAELEKPEEAMITKEEEGKKKLEDMLEAIEIELNLEDVDLRKIVDEISSRTKINIFVDWTAIKKATGLSERAPSGEGEGAEAAETPEPGEIKTMHLDMKIYSAVPLKSVLEYLMKITNLKYRVEEHAVLISTPQALEREEMVVKVYKLKYGMTKLRPVTLKPLGAEEK